MLLPELLEDLPRDRRTPALAASDTRRGAEPRQALTAGQRVVRVAHGDLEDCVGQATAAFGMELLRGGIAPGCWYPVELPVAARDRILAVVEEGAIVWEV